MGYKEEFISSLGADEAIPVGKPGALSAVEALATRDWYDEHHHDCPPDCAKPYHRCQVEDHGLQCILRPHSGAHQFEVSPAMGYAGHFFDVKLRIRVGPTESQETAEARIAYLLHLHSTLVDGTWEFIRD